MSVTKLGAVQFGNVDNPVWLSTSAAAKRIGVTPRTVYRFVDDGQLPAFRLGRVIRFRRDDIDAYINECRIQPGGLGHLYIPYIPDQK